MTAPVEVSPDVARHLLRGEELVADVHWHPVWLLAPTGRVVGLLVALGWVATNLPDSSGLARWVPFLALAVLARWGWAIATWRRERLLITDRRVLMVTGLLATRVGVIPLARVTDFTYERPLVGRLFEQWGWGTLRFESAGQQQAFSRIPFLPRPEAVYHALSEEIFGPGGIHGPRTPEPAPE